MPRTQRFWWSVLCFVVLAGGMALLVWPWVTNAQQPQNGKPKFAEDRAAVTPFDRDRAMKYLQQICDLGPRQSGTPAMAKQIDVVKKHFEEQGAKVELQKFTAKQRSQSKAVDMVNVIARWQPEKPRRVLLSAHYDTRPIADQEPNPRDWDKPFLAANDGAGGVAFFMEIAHHAKQLPMNVGLDLVLFDGEEYVFDNRPAENGGDRYFFGSEHFAQSYARERVNNPKSAQYVAAVNVDMIAGKNSKFYWEQYSIAQSPELCDDVWKVANELGVRSFVREVKYKVMDDHLELLKVRIPTIDIIDLDYPHWHRLTDVPANCSGETMEQVARVLLTWMQRAR